MEGRSKWRGRDPAEKKSSSDKVRHCCFLTRSARSVKSSRCVPSLEGRGRGDGVGGGEGGGKSMIPSALVEGGEHGYCRDLHICKTLGRLVASLSELPRT